MSIQEFKDYIKRYLGNWGSTTQATGVSAIKTIASIYDGAGNNITSTSNKLDVNASLAAGTNNIGDVDIASIAVPSAAADTWSAYDSVAYENAEVVKESAGMLRGLTGYNSGPAQWIQIHNTATIVADAAVPVIIIRAETLSNFVWSAGERGKWFSTGIMICNSTTGPTKTIGAADCWLNVLYK